MKLICRLLLALTLIPSVSASTQTSGAIEGVVVRAGTLEPISGVDLELTRLEEARTDVIGAGVVSQGSLRITFAAGTTARNDTEYFTIRTKADGRFRFSNLNAGTYRLLASRQDGAYCPAEYGQKDSRGPGLNIVLSEGELFRSANVEMIPPGTISGRV